MQKQKKNVLALLIAFAFIIFIPLNFAFAASATSSASSTNEMTAITGTIYTYNASSTLQSIQYIYYHIPFFLYIIIVIPALWIANRLLIEFIIRLRRER